MQGYDPHENWCLAEIVDAFRKLVKLQGERESGEYLEVRKFLLDELSPFHVYLGSFPGQGEDAFTREGMLAMISRIERGEEVKIARRKPGEGHLYESRTETCHE